MKIDNEQLKNLAQQKVSLDDIVKKRADAKISAVLGVFTTKAKDLMVFCKDNDFCIKNALLDSEITCNNERVSVDCDCHSLVLYCEGVRKVHYVCHVSMQNETKCFLGISIPQKDKSYAVVNEKLWDKNGFPTDLGMWLYENVDALVDSFNTIIKDYLTEQINKDNEILDALDK